MRGDERLSERVLGGRCVRPGYTSSSGKASSAAHAPASQGTRALASQVALAPLTRVVQGMACALALLWALAASFAFAPQALAYYSLDPVTIDLSSTELALEKGSVATVGCGIDPASEQQLPGCGMAECPQGCGDLTTPDGVVGGCQNDEGWCTCAGLNYVTYNTKVSITSSAPNVARASYTSGAITVKAYGAGTATITVKATLSKHADAVAQLVVAVSEPVKQEEQTQTDDSGSGTSGSGSSSTSGSSTSGSTASSSTSTTTSSSSGTTSTKSSSSKSGSTSSSKSKSTSTKSTSSSSGVKVTAASSTTTSSATGGVTIVGSSEGADSDTAEDDQAADDAQAEDADGEEEAEDSEAEPENFEVENASDAVGAVSSVSTVQSSTAKGGNATTGTAAAVMGAACIAVAAGVLRYRRWLHQREPIEGFDDFDDDGQAPAEGQSLDDGLTLED